MSAEVAEPVYWVRIEGVATLHDDAAELVERLCGRYLDLADPAHRQLDADIRAMRHETIRVRVEPERFFTSRGERLAVRHDEVGVQPLGDQRLEPFGAHCVGNAAPRVVVAQATPTTVPVGSISAAPESPLRSGRRAAMNGARCVRRSQPPRFAQ